MDVVLLQNLRASFLCKPHTGSGDLLVSYHPEREGGRERERERGGKREKERERGGKRERERGRERGREGGEGEREGGSCVRGVKD